MKIYDIVNEKKIGPGDRVGFDLTPLSRANKALSSATTDLNTIRQLDPANTALIKRLENRVNKLTAMVNKYANRDDAIPDNLMKLFKMFDKKCSTIMNAYRETITLLQLDRCFLHRGEDGHSTAITYSVPRHDRRPKDSSSLLHTYVNNALKDHGFDARRDNSAFCIASANKAAMFGDAVFIILPVDGFKFTWSPTERDAIFNLDFFITANLIDVNRLVDSMSYIKANHSKALSHFSMNTINKFLDRKDLDFLSYEAIRAIMHTTQTDSDPRASIAYSIDTDKFMAYMDYQKNDIVGAIQSNHEVYINGAYYGIRRQYANLLVEYLDTTPPV